MIHPSELLAMIIGNILFFGYFFIRMILDIQEDRRKINEYGKLDKP